MLLLTCPSCNNELKPDGGVCGKKLIPILIEKGLQDINKEKDGDTYQCPNGHRFCIDKSGKIVPFP